jgi:hypothetical protein
MISIQVPELPSMFCVAQTLLSVPMIRKFLRELYGQTSEAKRRWKHKGLQSASCPSAVRAA